MSHSIKRYEFLQLSAAAFACYVLTGPSCKRPASKKKIPSIGLQLYSVRDEFEKDPAGTIRKLAAMGYKQLESYERNEDLFWGLTDKGFKELIDELGISLVSSHCEIEKDFEKKAEQAAGIGMKFLIHNWPFAQQPLDVYKKMAEQYNRCGEICKKAGLRFAYHNYTSSYELVDGVYPQDLLMQNTEASLVDHQMDIYWVWRAGQDPVNWLKKYPGRYRLAHLKDGNQKTTGLLGKGEVDLRSFLTAARDQQIEYFIVEQEDYEGMSSLESARKNLNYMNSLF